MGDRRPEQTPDHEIIGVVIPAYRASRTIKDVVAGALRHAALVCVVDDCCQERTGDVVEKEFAGNGRVLLIRNQVNLGVGGATKAGMIALRERNCTIAVKIDADGQHDPEGIPRLVNALRRTNTDMAKGNRFMSGPRNLPVPFIRRFGNVGLTFLTRLSTGYWSIGDPINGFLALRTKLLPFLHLDKISNRYFFETDLLYQLGATRAMITDVPVTIQYNNEYSGVKIRIELFRFFTLHLKLFFNRIVWQYIYPDLHIGSICILLIVIFGPLFAIHASGALIASWMTGRPNEAGTLIIILIEFLIFFQSFFAWVQLDYFREPKSPFHILVDDEDAGP